MSSYRERARRWPGSGSRTPAVLAMVLFAPVVAGSSCVHPDVPHSVPPPRAPFVRAPYLQAVSESSAVVMWQATSTDTGSVRYRSRDEGWLHAEVSVDSGGARRALLRGLRPGRQVEYVVRTDGIETDAATFRTARGPSPDTVRVLAFGDSGYGTAEQIALARRMERRAWDLAIHVGDIAYVDGSDEAFTERHFRVYGDLLSRVPFFPAPGNHDLLTDGGAPYDRAFDWPGEERGRRHYSFRWGGVLFLALDTGTEDALESLVVAGGRQRSWLESELRSAAGDSTVLWRVVYVHHPLYSHAEGLSGHGPELELRGVLAPLFDEYGVDLVLTGHDHHYERSRPLRDGEPVARGCGPVYLVIGGGGAPRHFRSVDATGRQVAHATMEHHFLELLVLPRRITGRAVGLEGQTLDRFLLTRQRSEGPVPARCRPS